MSDKIKTRYLVKIPDSVTVLYSEQKKLIIITGPRKQKSVHLNLKLSLIKDRKLIYVEPIMFSEVSVNQRKSIKAFQGTTASLIRQSVIEVIAIIYQKLNIVGVGYKIFDVSNFKKEVYQFKLGFSHSLYYKIPENLGLFSQKFTKIFVYGSSYFEVTQNSSKIRSKKSPEPYKGKGILYENEHIVLKEGKKV